MLSDRLRSFKILWTYGISVLILAVMTMLLFRIRDTYQISLLLMASILAWIGIPAIKKQSLIDISLGLITIYEIVAFFIAECPIASFSTAFYFVFLLVVYFLLRRILTNSCAPHFILVGSYIPISIALLLAIGNFVVFRASVLETGFTDIYHFRFLFRPLGYITNTWAEIILVLLGWICLIRRYSVFFVFICVLMIFFSLSRGAYIALGVFLFTSLWGMKNRREKMFFVGICFVAAVLCCYILPQETKTVLQMNHTLSQRQSIAGRFDATQAAWIAFQKHPILGYGSNNFTYAIDPIINQDDTRAPISLAPNIVIQLLVEKGIIGTVLYFLLVLIITFFIWRHRKQQNAIVIGCTLFALLIREMSQSTLLNSPFLLFMFYALLAFLQIGKTEENRIVEYHSYFFLPSIALFFIVLWNIPSLLHKVDPTSHQINQAITYINNKASSEKDFSEAEQALQAALKRHPEDVQIRFLMAYLYNTKNQVNRADSLIKELVELYPNNALYMLTLSDIQYGQGDKDEALRSFMYAVYNIPRLLQNKRIQEWQKSDSVFYNRVINELLELQPSSEDSPADYARYGYIARWCNVPYEEYLRTAIEKLPNLATPWYLLGDLSKYKLLTYGVFYKKMPISTSFIEEEFTDNALFKRNYENKFKKWYGDELKDIE